VAAFDSKGTRLWNSYLGGDNDDIINGLSLMSDSLFVAGKTESHDFRTTTSSFQPTKSLNEDGFIVKIGTGSETPPPQ